MTSTENAEHKKGVGLFKHLKISPLLESKRLFSYISVLDDHTGEARIQGGGIFLKS